MNIRHIAAVALIAATLTACDHHDEIDFEGTVVGIRNCSSMVLDQNAGYLVQLTSPDSIGINITDTSGQTLNNIVVLYEPTRRIMVEDHIRGTFYIDNKYSRSNCNVRSTTELDIPEGVFTSVSVID